jgi:hypothetical protein
MTKKLIYYHLSLYVASLFEFKLERLAAFGVDGDPKITVSCRSIISLCLRPSSAKSIAAWTTADP